MKYRAFSDLGWNVSEIGLGCWQIGWCWGDVSDFDAKELLKKAIIQMLERNRPLKEKSYDLGISTGTVRNYIIEMRNDGINIPGFMKTQEGLSNADIQYRVNVIKSNPLKSPKEIAEIIGISRSTLNYFKKKYHLYL